MAPDVDAVVFDVDGTLVDSAEGIVAGYRHALTSVGFPPPSEEVLRSDLGPPVGELFTRLGLTQDLLEAGVAAYRRYYRKHGMGQARVYDQIPQVLDTLAARVPLGTATAKLTTVATEFLARLGLSERFAVVNGTDELHHTKTETLAHTLELMGRPDPARVLMVGDRHSDITAAHECGVRSAAVLWGYGTAQELRACGAQHLLTRPRQLVDLVG